MDRPALDRPARVLHQARPTVIVDVALALFLRRGEFAADAPGIAAPATDVVVVQDGDGARFGQIEQAPGHDLVTGAAIALLELQDVISAGGGVAPQPAGGYEEA